MDPERRSREGGAPLTPIVLRPGLPPDKRSLPAHLEARIHVLNRNERYARSENLWAQRCRLTRAGGGYERSEG